MHPESVYAFKRSLLMVSPLAGIARTGNGNRESEEFCLPSPPAEMSTIAQVCSPPQLNVFVLQMLLILLFCFSVY